MIEFKPLWCERRKQWIGCKVEYAMGPPTGLIRIRITEFGCHTKKEWAQDECDMFESGLRGQLPTP